MQGRCIPSKPAREEEKLLTMSSERENEIKDSASKIPIFVLFYLEVSDHQYSLGVSLHISIPFIPFHPISTPQPWSMEDGNH